MAKDQAKTIIRNIVSNMFDVNPHAIDVKDGNITIRLWEEPQMAEDIADIIGVGFTTANAWIGTDTKDNRITTIYNITFPIGRLFK